MQTVLHFYFSTDSFADCVIQAVNQGGDADTTGALAAMLAGATYGMAAIPGLLAYQARPESGCRDSRAGAEVAGHGRARPRRRTVADRGRRRRRRPRWWGFTPSKMPFWSCHTVRKQATQ